MSKITKIGTQNTAIVLVCVAFLIAVFLVACQPATVIVGGEPYTADNLEDAYKRDVSVEVISREPMVYRVYDPKFNNVCYVYADPADAKGGISCPK
jgi:hypothetical protein